MYNKLITSKDVSICKDILEKEKWPEKGFRGEFWDKDAAIVKWVSLLQEFKSIGKNNLTVIDLGSANGVIPHIIASWGNDVTGIDLMSVDHWCPKGLAKMVLGDALYELKQMEPESVDVIIDSCSVHCFNPTWGDGIENWGWKNVADEVHRVLKPNGRLLISTDVTLSPDPGEFISPENIIKIVESSGLKLTSRYRKEYEQPHHQGFYQENVNLYIATLSFKKDSNYCTSFYNLLFSPFKYKQINFGEIGIYKNSSMKIWREYFSNAHLYGWDNDSSLLQSAKEDNLPDTSYDYMDVTSEVSICEAFEKSNSKFDILIDDSDHTFWSRIKIIRNAYKYLNPGGILIIEGLLSEDSFESYMEEINLYGHNKFYDSIKKINTHHIMGNGIYPNSWILILTRNEY